MAGEEQDLLIRIRGDVGNAADAIGNLRGHFTGLNDVLSGLTSTTGILTTGIGLLVAGAMEAVHVFLEDAKAARELAFQTGLTVEQADALAKTFRIAGASADILRIGMMRMSLELETGGKHIRQLGVELRDQSGVLKTQGVLFFEVIDRLASLGNEQERNAEMVRIFGRGSKELIPVLEQWNHGMRETYAQLAQGTVITTKAAEEAQKLEIQWNKARETMRAWWETAGSVVVNGLKQFSIWFTQGNEEFRKYTEQLDIAAHAQEIFGRAIQKTAQAQYEATHKALIGEKEAMAVRQQNAILMEKLHAEDLKAQGKTVQSQLLMVKIRLEEEKAKIIEMSKFKDEQQIRDLAKTNAVAKEYVKILAQMEKTAQDQRKEILGKAQEELGKKILAAAHKEWEEEQKILKERGRVQEELAKKIVENYQKEYKEHLKMLGLQLHQWESYGQRVGDILGAAIEQHKNFMNVIKKNMLDILREMLFNWVKSALASIVAEQVKGIAAATAEAPSTWGASMAWIPQIIAAATAAIGAMSAVKMQYGGYIPGNTPTFAMIGEGPKGEYVIPEDRMGGITINIGTLTATRQQAQELARIVGDALMGRLRSLRTV